MSGVGPNVGFSYFGGVLPIPTSGYIGFGSPTAASGYLRFPHGSAIAKALDSDGTTTRTLIDWGVSGNSELRLGDTAANYVTLTLSPSGLFVYDGASPRLIIDTAIKPYLDTMQWSAGSNPQLGIADSNTIQAFTVSGPGAASGNTNGGPLRLRSGRPRGSGTSGSVTLSGSRADGTTFDEGLAVSTSGSAATLGFYGAAPSAKLAVTGSRGGNAALASLLTQLAALGLITDSSSA